MKKTILYFVEVFGWGGIETFVSNVCSRLDKGKYNIRIVAINKISDHFDSMLDELGIIMDVLVPTRYESPFIRFSKGLKPFYRYIRQYKDAIVHFNVSNSVDLLYVLIAKRRGIKNRIVHCHNSNATNNVKKFAHYFLKLSLAENGSCNMACSAKAAKWLFSNKTYKNGDYIRLHNAINTKDYIFDESLRKRMRTEFGWCERFVVGHIGRFNTQKNHRFLIDIFEEIVRINEKAILVLIGEGALEEETRSYVYEKNLENYVMFFGMTSDIRSVLQAMDVFLLPSLYEGLPFVLVETQSASLPALVSDTITDEVNITEYITYYSLKCTAREWAEKTLEIAAIPRKVSTERLVSGGFDLSTMVRELDEIYSTM